MKKKPFILVSNDDGITSKGIAYLVHQMKKLGDVGVVAPNKPQSGMGHAITVASPLRLTRSSLFSDIEAYECSGTPADCVKLAKHSIFNKRKIDLVASGINHGSNTSISVLYSGTMSAAIEGAMEGVPAIGFSLCDYDPESELNHTGKFVRQITENVLNKGIPKGIALNVNFPTKQKENIKGIKICRQANAYWEETFDERTDPYGQKYYWMVGNFVNHDRGEDNDEDTISRNYVSIVPCQYDLTDYRTIQSISKNWKIS